MTAMESFSVVFWNHIEFVGCNRTIPGAVNFLPCKHTSYASCDTMARLFVVRSARRCDEIMIMQDDAPNPEINAPNFMQAYPYASLLPLRFQVRHL